MPPFIALPGGQIVPIQGAQSVVVTADADVDVWHPDANSAIANPAARSVTWVLPNKTRSAYSLYGTGPGGQSNTLQVQLNSLLPNYWDFKVPIMASKQALSFKPQSGPTQTRTLDGRQLVYQLGSERIREEYFYELLDFWTFHHPGAKFLFDDPTLQRRVLFESNAERGKLNFAPLAGGFYSWNWQIEEAWPYGSSQ